MGALNIEQCVHRRVLPPRPLWGTQPDHHPYLAPADDALDRHRVLLLAAAAKEADLENEQGQG